MATSITYHYSIQSDFPNHIVATDRLMQEIQKSAIVVALDRVDTSGDDCAVVFRDALSTGDKTTLDGLVAVHTGEALPWNVPSRVLISKPSGDESPLTSDGRLRIATEKADGSRANFFSHDWTDPTTWYQQSVYVADEATTVDSADTSNATWLLAHSPVIDTYHGKITQEDFIKDSSSRSYRVTVKLNGTTKTEQDPHVGSGGDYTIDYDNGKVVFLSAPNVSDAITVTYHYANLAAANGTASLFTIAPASGKKLTLIMAEGQFSTDCDPRDSIVFEVMGIADYFMTSAQMAAYGIPAGVGYKISLQKFVYKSFSDFQNDAMRSYPSYPAMGASNNWRSQKQPVTVFDWDYVSGSYVQSSKGMELRMYLQHDAPFGGWMATASLYMISETDA